MPGTDATGLLRAGLLDGVRILVAGPGRPRGGEPAQSAVAGGPGLLGRIVLEACAALGARVRDCAIGAEGPEEAGAEALEIALRELGGLELLVLDGDGLFAHAGLGSGSRDGLLGCLEVCWSVTRAVAERAFIAPGSGGRIVYLAPAPTAGSHARAATAGLENLARTLSIEWARYGVTPVTIAPGGGTSAGEVAALTAYLASPAGAYFSGCLLDLRGAES